MKVVFNVYADPRNSKYEDYLFTLHDVLKAKEQGIDFKTNVMYEMDSCWFDSDYEIYLVDQLGKEYKLCNDGKLTVKDLRPAHNVFKMWRSGSFCDHNKNRYFK